METIGRSEFGELGCPFGNLAQEISSLHEPLRESLSMFFGACTETMERCFEEGKQAGIFQQALPSRQIAEFILAQIQGAFLLRKTHKDPEVLENSFQVLRGLLRQWSA
jgi:TetR/AcrR family transcriptional repressor of nem operon